jgi:hypothetical protein
MGSKRTIANLSTERMRRVMLHNADKGSMANGDRDQAVREKGKNILLVERCPTPGCNCGQVRANYNSNGILTGFSCAKGCVYRAKINALTGKVDSYELIKFNPYKVDANSGGYIVGPDGSKLFGWL